jgi:hypothetical protein
VGAGAVVVGQVEGRWWQGGSGRWASRGVVAVVDLVMIVGGKVG